MMKITSDEYKRLAAALKANEAWRFEHICRQHSLFYGVYEGYVQPKERPRSGASGVVYTPVKTKKFEASVEKWAIAKFPHRPVFFPVELEITVTDEYPDNVTKAELWIMEHEMVHRQVGDLDNKVKAITDAANGLLYKDDKQIKHIVAKRTYGRCDGFSLTMWRSGLSKNEVANLLKHLR